MKRYETMNLPAWPRVLLLLLGLVMPGWLGCGASTQGKTDPKQEADQVEDPSAEPESPAPTGKTDKPVGDDGKARAVLDAMVAAYRTAQSYSDEGRVRMTGKLGDQGIDEKADVFMAMVRPNKIGLQAYQGMAVSDGKTLRAYAAMIPTQVLEVPAPPELTIDSIFSNSILADSMAQGPTQEFSWVPLQVVLLMADDPLKTLLYQATRTRLLPPEKIDEWLCDRVEVTRADGVGVLWVDRKTRVLRRFEYPTENLKKLLAGGRVENLSLVADFASAQLGQSVDPRRFQFDVPPEAKTVAALTPPGLSLLGKPSPDFFFVGLDNKPVTMKSLAGKVVVLDFWATWCQACRESLPEMERVYQSFKGNDKVAFLAVNVEPESVPSVELEKVFGELNVHLPIVRDLQRHFETALGVTDFPTTVILGPDGVVQAFEPGLAPGSGAGLVRQIDKLLAGGDLHGETLQVYEAVQKDYKRIFDEMLKQDLFVSPAIILQQLPQTGVAERSEPTAMKLAPLWENTDLDAPGNILVVPGSDAAPRLLVIRGGKAVVELDAAGKLVANHVLDVPEREFVILLRTAVGADGRRWYIGTTPELQQVHLFDEKWKLLWSFPPDAHENPHAGVGDAQIADLNGDGAPEVVVGYRGLVGVKCVSLDGKVLWSNRSVANVLGMAVGAPDANRQRLLFSTNDQSSLAVIDASGKDAGRLALGGHLLYAIAASDLDGDGQAEICGLSAPKIGENLALLLNARGELLASYDLPPGTPGQLIERISAVRLAPGPSAQWLLAGVDGSIHLVGFDGKPIDHFNHGTLIGGLAATEINGRPVLLVSTRQGLAAYTVEWK